MIRSSANSSAQVARQLARHETEGHYRGNPSSRQGEEHRDQDEFFRGREATSDLQLDPRRQCHGHHEEKCQEPSRLGLGQVECGEAGRHDDEYGRSQAVC